jgi:hypothetical protein
MRYQVITSRYVTGSEHHNLNKHSFLTLCIQKMVVKQLLYLIVKRAMVVAYKRPMNQ